MNSDPDTLSYNEAMVDVDQDLWIAAARKEIKSLEDHGTWTEVDISEATSKILPSQWVFRCRRTPDGNVKSHKGCTVARGDLEEGVLQTYAPVVAWSTVRLFLILLLILSWHTCSINFSRAFIQVTLENQFGYTFLMVSNLREQERQFSNSTKASTACRWHQSSGMNISSKSLARRWFHCKQFDPCLLFKRNMMLAVYADVCRNLCQTQGRP